jgi:hypothetical protein
MQQTITEQCNALYRQQAAAIAQTDKENVARATGLACAFAVPLVVAKLAPSAVILAGIAGIVYVGHLVGKDLGSKVHDHCVKVTVEDSAQLKLQV